MAVLIISSCRAVKLSHSPSRGCAVGVDAAGVGGAGLQTTGGEGVTDVVGATLTDGSLTSGATLGIDSAGGLLAGVEVTLDERISFIVGTTLAHGSGSGGGAVGVDTTRGLGAGVEDAVDEGVALNTQSGLVLVLKCEKF